MRTARLIVSGVACVLCMVFGPFLGSRVSAGDSMWGGADGDTVWAGVQTGTPPTAGGSDASGCTWKPATVYDSGIGGSPSSATKTVGAITYDLYERHCPGGMTLVWIPRVGSTTLAHNASTMVAARLPLPSLQMAPTAASGVVDVATWLWLASDQWRPVSATAWIPGVMGPVWARTTATPRRFTFVTQDDGTREGSEVAKVVCEGRGEEWRVELGDEASSECSYTYRHSSAHRVGQVFVALVIVEWETRFTSSNGNSGVLESLQSSAFVNVRVDELQALVR